VLRLVVDILWARSFAAQDQHGPSEAEKEDTSNSESGWIDDEDTKDEEDDNDCENKSQCSYDDVGGLLSEGSEYEMVPGGRCSCWGMTLSLFAHIETDEFKIKT